MKKGYVLTLDALLALMVVMVVYTLIMGIQSSINVTEITEFKALHYISEDTMQALSEKGVLDQVCVQWALAGGSNSSTQFDTARNISNAYLSEMLPVRVGYKLMLNGTVVTNSSRLPENESSVKTHSMRILSGYNTRLPTDGYMARARINDTNVSYGSVFLNNTGCIWKIQTVPNGGNITLRMPSTYAGATICNYTNTSISYVNDSAVNDAVYRLLSKNDVSPRNGVLDSLDLSNVTTDVAVMSSIRSMSSPVEVKLVLWMK
jgi:hypothetical protein